MSSITFYFTVAATAPTGGLMPWQTPNNALTANSQYAYRSMGAGQSSDYLTLYRGSGASGFVPAGATINGITVHVTRKSSNVVAKDKAVKLLGSFGIGTINKASNTAWPSTAATVTYGGATDKWGLALTPDIVNDALFGVLLQATSMASDVASVDVIYVDVAYAPFAAATISTVNSVHGHGNHLFHAATIVTSDNVTGDRTTAFVAETITTVDTVYGTGSVPATVPSTMNIGFGVVFNCKANNAQITSYNLVHGSTAEACHVADIGATSSVANGAGIITIIVDGNVVTSANTKASSYLIHKSNPWVLCSKIGEMNFQLDITGDAFTMPMSFGGDCWEIKKLGSKVIVYGQDGISQMTPYENNWGEAVLMKNGIYGQNAVCGNEQVHFFIDSIGQLWELSDGLKKHDYREFFSAMGYNLVMSYDELLNIVYICDGNVGYVFSQWGLGQGPANITGIGRRGQDFYIVAPGEITVDPMDCIGDIIDFGERRKKTVVQLQFGSTVTGTLQAALDYRQDRMTAFKTTPWVNVTRDGMAYFTITAQEFRPRWRMQAYEDIKIDRIELVGLSTTAQAVNA